MSPSEAAIGSAERRIEPGLLVAERRHRILELLREEGRVTVDDLASRFATSLVTIRTDLATLEANGALERTHGGALLRRDEGDLPISVKQTRHHAEKVRIAKFAAALIQLRRGSSHPKPASPLGSQASRGSGLAVRVADRHQWILPQWMLSQ